jgi:hypothetical protein
VQALRRNYHGTLQVLEIALRAVPVFMLDLLDLLRSPHSSLQTLVINCCWDLSEPISCDVLRERIQTAFASNTSLCRLVVYEQADEPPQLSRTVLFLEELHFLEPLRKLSWNGAHGVNREASLRTMKALSSSLASGNVTHLELRHVTFDSAEMMECLSRALWSRPERPLSVLSLDSCAWTTEEATGAFWQFWQHPAKNDVRRIGDSFSTGLSTLVHTLYLNTCFDGENGPCFLVEPGSTTMPLILQRMLSPAEINPHSVIHQSEVSPVGSKYHCTGTVGSTLQRLEIGPDLFMADVMTALMAADIRLPCLRFKAYSFDEEGILAITSALPALIYLREFQLHYEENYLPDRLTWATSLEAAIRANGSLCDFEFLLTSGNGVAVDLWTASAHRSVSAYGQRNACTNALVVQLLSMTPSDSAQEPVAPLTANANLSHAALVPTLWSVVRQAPRTAPNSILAGLLSMSN